jgi:hypothetical protein
MRRFLARTALVVVVSATVALIGVFGTGIARAQSPARDDGSSDEIPRHSVPQNSPCLDQPKSLSEVTALFKRGQLPEPSQVTGTWVEIGQVSEFPKSPRYRSLNCSGVSRGSKFEFALVADGYSIELHAIGIEYPETATMEPDHKGSIEFREVDFGGEGTLDNYRCRLTNDQTLVCLLGPFSGVQFKKMAVERRQLP